jgi:hypothetical protein
LAGGVVAGEIDHQRHIGQFRRPVRLSCSTTLIAFGEPLGRADLIADQVKLQ